MIRWIFRFSKRTRRPLCRVSGIQGEKGFTYAFMVIILPILLGFMALVIEVGMVVEVRRNLQTMADAAALAGAQLLPNTDTTLAEAEAQAYVGRHDPSGSVDRVEIDVKTVFWENDAITVTVSRTLPLTLIPILDPEFKKANVAATATAIVGSLGLGECLVPLGVVDKNGEDTSGGDPSGSWQAYAGNGFGYTFGLTTTLKFGGGSGYTGNFRPLAPYGPGAKDYYDAISGSCPEGSSVGVGDYIDTEPGAKTGKTVQAFKDRIGTDTHSFSDVAVWDEATKTAVIKDPNCPRIVLVPIIPAYIPNGRSDPVLIVGFARFFIVNVTEEVDPKAKPPDNKIGVVTGLFIDTVLPEEIVVPYNPLGTRVVRLIR